MFKVADYGIREGDGVRVRTILEDRRGGGMLRLVGQAAVVEEISRGWTTLEYRRRGGLAVLRIEGEPERTYVLLEAELEPLSGAGRVPAEDDLLAAIGRDRAAAREHPELGTNSVVRDARTRQIVEADLGVAEDRVRSLQGELGRTDPSPLDLLGRGRRYRLRRRLSDARYGVDLYGELAEKMRVADALEAELGPAERV